MKTVNVHQAKTHLSKLLEEVAAGNEIVVARAGKPVAKLVKFQNEPALAPHTPRQSGALKGQIWIAADFDEVPDEVHRAMNLGEDA